jgi:hypothetical protein
MTELEMAHLVAHQPGDDLGPCVAACESVLRSMKGEAEKKVVGMCHLLDINCISLEQHKKLYKFHGEQLSDAGLDSGVNALISPTIVQHAMNSANERVLELNPQPTTHHDGVILDMYAVSELACQRSGLKGAEFPVADLINSTDGVVHQKQCLVRHTLRVAARMTSEAQRCIKIQRPSDCFPLTVYEMNKAQFEKESTASYEELRVCRHARLPAGSVCN